ncbi:Thioesterase [Penicillium vulpinum]|uniref:AMP-dependent synthetase/ligase domain-containing protein n=1 Tax=Penicillium vulpinum TaxID=29845 RepID=A0A1V6RXG7_9EURO|nr:Thioesterase [Penicillium vulpinum]KAJ5970186.1 Thioesterase [Penicillium vulpinum]OQE06179.1 hypothetical protein PENVUL_c019G02409 [Penicillium vulpinum]
MNPVSVFNIRSLLDQVAVLSAGIIAYPEGDRTDPVKLSYAELRNQALQRASWLQTREEFRPGGVILVHFRRHLDNITWSWATILAGSIPTLSPALVSTIEGRKAHFKHLHNLLQDPLLLSRRDLLTDSFGENEILRTVAVEEFEDYGLKETESDSATYSQTNGDGEGHANDSDVAVLMLTSGSSGNCKAVCLTHQQMFASIRGKLTVMPVSNGSSVLNWIGLDHVASLMETHLLSINPLLFLRLLSKHKVSMTFAPDFFLCKLLMMLDTTSKEAKQEFDLSKLLYLVSGGEPHNIDTDARVTRHLQSLGVSPSDLITPGFVMTEICARAIYDRNFPDIDIKAQREDGALGSSIPKIEIRIAPIDANEPSPGTQSNSADSGAANGAGVLEVRRR